MNKKENKKEYITLQEATKYCDYSQEYLSLRARQGKLKAVKLKRSWLTKKEWLKDYLKQPANYISLKDAVKYCDYSHDYLSLRARQKKLKAVKFGKNWLTKKEWLKDYLENNQKQLKEPEQIQEEKLEEIELSEQSQMPRALPIIKMLRAGALFILISVLLMSGATAGKNLFLKTFTPYLMEAYKNLSLRSRILILRIKISGKFIDNSILPIIENSPILKSVVLNVAGVGQTTADVLQGYFSWLGNSFKSMSSKLVKTYLVIHNSFDKEIKQGLEVIKGFFSYLSGGIKNFFSYFPETIKNFFSRGKIPTDKLLTEDTFIETEERLTEKLIEAFQQGFEKLTRQGIPSKQIITQIQPIKEITKEIKTIDSASLIQLRADIEYVQTELTNRLYAPGGVITQQIYVTEPIQSPKVYQDNGEIVLQTLGSGNITLSAATGLQLHGQQVVINSTNIQNPLIYLSDETIVNGPITAQTITLNAPSDFTGRILDVQSADDSKFYVENTGNAFLLGSFTITGDLSVTGNQTLNGTLSLNASSSSSILTVNQTGNGKIFNFTSTAESTQNLGTITGITTNAILALYQQGTGSVLIATTTASSTEAAIKVTNLGTGDSFVIESQDTDSSPFVIDSSGRVGIATSSPLYVLQAWGSVFIGTSTTPTLFVDSGTEKVGIGTSTPSQALHVAGNVLGSGNAVFEGVLDIQGYTTSTFAGPLQITTTTQPQLVVRYDSTNYLTASVSSAGLSSLVSTGSLALSAAEGLNLTGAGSSVWQTTNYGSLTIQSASSTEIRAGHTLTASSTNEMLFITASQERMRILTSGYVGIATTSPRYLLDVWGSAGFGTTTDTNVPVLYVDSGNGRIGIASSTPNEALAVAGNIFGSGNITISGDIMPTNPRNQDIGSEYYDWQNIYADSVYVNNLNAASSTVSGTSAETFTINSDAAANATSSLRFYKGVNTPHALLSWNAGYDRFNFNFPLYLSGTGAITASSALTFYSGNGLDITLDSAGKIVLSDDTDINANLDVSGSLTVGSADQFYIDSLGNATTTGVFYAAAFNSASDDATIRKLGDQIVRGVVPIFGFDLPARTASSSYTQVSRYIENDAFPSAYSGTARKYKFAIRYADATTTVASSWQIATTSDPSSITFTVPASVSADLSKGNAYIAELTNLPAEPWRLDVKTGGSGDYSIQIYDIVLIAVDEVN